MKRLTLVAAASLIAGAGLLGSVAVSQEGGRSVQPGMHGQPGMMGGGMMGGGMMQGCPMMSRASSAGGNLIPQLPPGNEKLQAQMAAEIMQKAGEIASKYAAQAK